MIMPEIITAAAVLEKITGMPVTQPAGGPTESPARLPARGWPPGRRGSGGRAAQARACRLEVAAARTAAPRPAGGPAGSSWMWILRDSDLI